MGYFYGDLASTNLSDLLKEIKGKTGITIEYTGSPTMYDVVSIQFPEKEKVNCTGHIYYDSQRKHTYLANVDDGFFMLMPQKTKTAIPELGDYTRELLSGIIIASESDAIAIPGASSSDYAIRNSTNAVNPSNNDVSATSITIYQAAIANYDDKKAYLIKNMYTNAERAFTQGLVLEADNGDRYLTLGSYFLYKIN